MKKIILILIIFNLFYINKVKAEEKEYVKIEMLSTNLLIDYNMEYKKENFYNIADNVEIETVYDRKNKISSALLLTKQECLNKIKDIILKKYSNFYNYFSGGLYQNTLSKGAYGRYFCAKYKDIEKYIDFKKDFFDNFNFKDFNKGENKNMPLFVDEKTIPEVYNSLFPLDKDQKEAVKITKKFDKEIKKLLKKKRESNIKDYYK